VLSIGVELLAGLGGRACGMPRAVKRASRSGLPGAPGRLGCLAAERLMVWAGFVPVSALYLFL